MEAKFKPGADAARTNKPGVDGVDVGESVVDLGELVNGKPGFVRTYKTTIPSHTTKITLPETNIAMENPQFWWDFHGLC